MFIYIAAWHVRARVCVGILEAHVRVMPAICVCLRYVCFSHIYTFNVLLISYYICLCVNMLPSFCINVVHDCEHAMICDMHSTSHHDWAVGNISTTIYFFILISMCTSKLNLGTFHHITCPSFSLDFFSWWLPRQRFNQNFSGSLHS